MSRINLPYRKTGRRVATIERLKRKLDLPDSQIIHNVKQFQERNLEDIPKEEINEYRHSLKQQLENLEKINKGAEQKMG